MKTTYGWYNGGTGTNSSGFAGLPGGYVPDGNSYDAGVLGFWWSSSIDFGSLRWARLMLFGEEGVGIGSFEPRLGLSVRCIKDAE